MVYVGVGVGGALSTVYEDLRDPFQFFHVEQLVIIDLVYALIVELDLYGQSLLLF